MGQAKPVDSANYLVKMSSQALAAGLSSFGSGIGQGFQNYMAGRERRELLSGEAMAYGSQLKEKQAQGIKLSSNEEAMLKKLENVGDMGTRELQNIIAEYETDEKMEQLQRSKRLQELQIRNAERKEKSELDLMRFGKSIPEMESEFVGPSFGQFENVPAYLLDPSKRQVGDPMIPSYDQDAPVQGPSMAMYEDIQKVTTPQPPLPPKSIPMGKKEAGRWLDKELNIYKGEEEKAQKELDAHIKKYEGQAGAQYIASTQDIYGDDGIIDNIQSRLASFGRDQFDDPVYQKSRDLSRKLDRAKERVSYLEEEKSKNEYLPPLVVKGEEREPLVSYNAEKAMSNLAQDPSYYDPKLDSDRLGSKQVTGSFLEDAGDTLSDRRDKLVSALSDYSLTPQDRKQALELIGEKYPKLKEVATEAVSPSGDKLGFTIGGKFIPAKSSVTGVGVGAGDMEISSLTVNDKGEVTKILKPKEKLNEAQKTLLANAKEFKHQAKQLLKVVDSHGGWESSLSAALSDSSAKAKADLDSLSYRMAILYSKIVDPATAAREGEVVAAKKYAFPMGFWVPNSVTVAAVNSMLEEVMRRESNFYETEGMEQPEEATPSNSVNNSNPLGY